MKTIYEEMELEIISSLKRALTPIDDINQWQKAVKGSKRRFKAEVKQSIARAEKKAKIASHEAILDGTKRAKDNMSFFVRNLVYVLANFEIAEYRVEEEWEDLETEIRESPLATDYLDAFYEEIDKEIETISKVTQKRVEDIYDEIIRNASRQYRLGKLTLPEAIDKATADFLRRGIDSITYTDGRKVNVASYAEMALRTSIHKSYLHAEGEMRDKLGIHTVKVSKHEGSCPRCIPFEDRILIDDVFSNGKPDGKHILLSDAMDEGLLHPSCRHNLNTTYHGITLDRKNPLRVIEWLPESIQKRALERAITRQKRRVAGVIDTHNSRRERLRLTQLQQRLSNL